MASKKRTFEHYQDRFSIRDLESYSGVKAHTIRIWERRYGLLKPDRTDTNIRYYGIDELRTLLNASLLVRSGISISAVAELSMSQRAERVRELGSGSIAGEAALDQLKLAMLTYDELLFEHVTSRFLTDHGFEGLVEKLYLPLLRSMGILWQTDSIVPAQEHFISALIRSKIIVASDALASVPPLRDDFCCVLFLPENEIHDLGLVYLKFLVRKAGIRTVYLGNSIPLADLVDVTHRFSERLAICSIFTVKPEPDRLSSYLKDLGELISRENIEFHFSGSMVIANMDMPRSSRIHFHKDIRSMVDGVAHENLQKR